MKNTNDMDPLQGHSVVVVDVEAQWNIYSSNIVPGDIFPGELLSQSLAWRGSYQYEDLLSGVPDLFDRNKILSGGDLSHYQVPHCIRVFFYFVWFVFIHHNFQFYFELCTYGNILDIYLS